MIEFFIDLLRIGSFFQGNFDQSRLIIFPTIQFADLVEVSEHITLVKFKQSRLENA